MLLNFLRVQDSVHNKASFGPQISIELRPRNTSRGVRVLWHLEQRDVNSSQRDQNRVCGDQAFLKMSRTAM